MSTAEQRRDAAAALRRLLAAAAAGELAVEGAGDRAILAQWRGAAAALELSARRVSPAGSSGL